jgi:hypothetical protein
MPRLILHCLTMLSISILVGQPSARAQEQTKLLRDIVSRVVSAAGGQEALASVGDLTESGQITFHWAQDVVGPVVIRSVGRNRFRMEADLPQGKQTWIVKNGVGKRKEGSLEFPLSHENAINLENLTFPISHLAAALSDDHTTLTLIAIEKLENKSVYRLRLDGMLDLVESKEQGALTSKEVIVDALTFDILRIEDYPCIVREPHSQKPSAIPPRRIEYGDFRLVNGVRVPFFISTTLNGERTLTIQIDEANFNTNVPETDFDASIDRRH